MRTVVSTLHGLFALATLAGVPTLAAAGDSLPLEEVSFNYSQVEVQAGTYGRSTYQISLDGPSVEDAVFRLYDDGRLVGTFASDDGFAPFVTDVLPEEHEVRTGDAHKGEIEIMSWSMGVASTSDGRRIAFDAIVTEIPVALGHELGHVLGFRHEHTTPTSPYAGMSIRIQIDAADAAGAS